MKIYLAAPWVAKEEARWTAQRLVSAGHKITKPWWEHREVAGYPGPVKGPALDELIQQAWEDWEGVVSADRVVVLQLAKSEGKAFETGLAAAYRIPICVVSPSGEHGNLFQY